MLGIASLLKCVSRQDSKAERILTWLEVTIQAMCFKMQSHCQAFRENATYDTLQTASINIPP